MALSPLAALSLPLVQDPAWASSARAFGDSVRERLQQTLSTDGFKQWVAALDERITFMDWSFGVTGVDLTQVTPRRVRAAGRAELRT